MWLIPLLALVIASFCSGALFRCYLAARSPVFLAWSFSLALLAVAAACAAIGSYDGWTELTARLYYLTAAAMFTGFMGLGTVYINAPRVIGHVWLVILLGTAILAAFLLAGTEVDPVALAAGDEPGWGALETGNMLVGIVSALSSISVLILVVAAVAGVVYRRAGREQVMVAGGVLMVALAGGLSRLDDWEWTFAGQAAGIALITYGAWRLFRGGETEFV